MIKKKTLKRKVYNQCPWPFLVGHVGWISPTKRTKAMSRYAIIYPNEHKIVPIKADDYKEGMKIADLNGVDFGVVKIWPNGQSLNIIIYEFGLLDGKNEGYFSLEKRLYRGNAILFITDENGETTYMPLDLISEITNHILWLDTIANAEAAIQRGDIIRPQIRINGKVVWSWGEKCS